MFMRRWIQNKRGRLSVIQNIPAVKDGAHTSTIIPAILDCMRGKFTTLRQWGKWVLLEQKPSVWHPRVHIDGDLLQVFAALETSGFHKYDWSDAESLSSSTDDLQESSSSDSSSESSDEDGDESPTSEE